MGGKEGETESNGHGNGGGKLKNCRNLIFLFFHVSDRKGASLQKGTCVV